MDWDYAKGSLSQRAATFRSRRANLPRLVNFIGLFRPGEGKEPRQYRGTRERARSHLVTPLTR